MTNIWCVVLVAVVTFTGRCAVFSFVESWDEKGEEREWKDCASFHTYLHANLCRTDKFDEMWGERSCQKWYWDRLPSEWEAGRQFSDDKRSNIRCVLYCVQDRSEKVVNLSLLTKQIVNFCACVFPFPLVRAGRLFNEWRPPYPKSSAQHPQLIRNFKCSRTEDLEKICRILDLWTNRKPCPQNFPCKFILCPECSLVRVWCLQCFQYPDWPYPKSSDKPSFPLT